MPQITNQTQVIAIQAVAWEVRSMRETIAHGAAEDLEWACEADAKTVINLPPHHELVGG